VKRATAASLVALAERVRRLREQGLAEGPGTRLLVATARLIAGGIPVTEACRVALAAPLTDDPDLLAAIFDLIDATV
jgi:nitric oxide reductase NorQ protein